MSTMQIVYVMREFWNFTVMDWRSITDWFWDVIDLFFSFILNFFLSLLKSHWSSSCIRVHKQRGIIIIFKKKLNKRSQN